MNSPKILRDGVEILSYIPNRGQTVNVLTIPHEAQERLGMMLFGNPSIALISRNEGACTYKEIGMHSLQVTQEFSAFEMIERENGVWTIDTNARAAILALSHIVG